MEQVSSNRDPHLTAPPVVCELRKRRGPHASQKPLFYGSRSIVERDLLSIVLLMAHSAVFTVMCGYLATQSLH